VNKAIIISIICIVTCILWSCGEKPENGKIVDGKTIFKSYCVTCHGIDGSLMTNGAKDLRISNLNLEERVNIITNGRNIMTSFKNTLTKSQIESVAKYSQTLNSQIQHAE
jgi:cytochrome c6